MSIRISSARPPDEQPLGPAALEVAWDRWGSFTPAERMYLVDRGFSPAQIAFRAACRQIERICDEADRRESNHE